MEREVLEVRDSPDGVAFKSLETEPQYKSISWYRIGEDLKTYRLKSKNSEDGVYYTFDPPYIATGVVTEGGSWSSKFKTIRHQPGKEDEIISEIEYGIQVSGRETIEVPAGKFDTFVLESNDLKDREWVAEGVGMVKFQGKLNGRLIEYELVKYSVR